MSRRALVAFSAGLALALALGWLGLPRLLYARSEQPLRFSDRTHTSDRVGSTCADCHPFDAEGRFAGIPKIESCSVCHAEPQGPSAEDVLTCLISQFRLRYLASKLTRLSALWNCST